jgi:recombination associated protein RdgC
VFKNVTIYRIAPGWAATLEAMETALDAARFIPCGATQDKAVGWVEPRGEAHGPLAESVAGQRILKLMIETKAVPGSVVREKAQEEADHIEATTGRKPGKKETKALREDALLALLPQAFPRRMGVWVWIDLANGLLVTDASSQGKQDELVTALVNAFNDLSLTLLQTAVTPQTAMTGWLAAPVSEEDEGGAPGGFAVERECELKSGDEEKSVVKFTRHNLATDEVRKHIVEGKLPTRLAMSWEGRIGFVLTESMQLKRLAFLEGVFDDRADDSEGGFDTDVALSTGELGKLIPELIEALGGEIVPGMATPGAGAGPAAASAPRGEAVTAVGDDESPF